MLCVLLNKQEDRENLLININNNQIIFDDATILESDKIVRILHSVSPKPIINGNKIMIEDFMALSSEQKINGMFLLWADISCSILFEKQLHYDWIKN